MWNGDNVNSSHRSTEAKTHEASGPPDLQTTGWEQEVSHSYKKRGADGWGPEDFSGDLGAKGTVLLLLHPGGRPVTWFAGFGDSLFSHFSSLHPSPNLPGQPGSPAKRLGSDSPVLSCQECLVLLAIVASETAEFLVLHGELLLSMARYYIWKVFCHV